MGEQSADLRSTLAILRRNRRVLIGAAVLGVVVGVGLVILRPPMYSSISDVQLPPAEDSSGQSISRAPETAIRVASSQVVLGPAGKNLDPPMSARALSKRVHVTALTPDLLRIEAMAESKNLAQEIAKEVAQSELTYVTKAASSPTNVLKRSLADREKKLKASLDRVNREIKKAEARKSDEDPTSAQGRADETVLAQLTAQQASLVLQADQVKSDASVTQPDTLARLIQKATPAKRAGLVGRFLVSALVGLVAATMIAAILLAVFGRRDRRLRLRDELADAVGSPVIASLRSQVPRGVAGWTSLLESYSPGTVDAWAMRQALRQLVFGESAIGPRRASTAGDKVHHPLSITVLTLSDDPRGLAMGPQMASYAASVGVRTRLVAVQGHEAAAALWAACSGALDDEEIRPGLLVDTRPRHQDDVDLTVVLAVLDRRKPELLALPGTSVTILAVSSGSATAEDLARAAVTADDAGCRIAGIIVADPDNMDRTTGRLLQHERSQEVPLPTRLTGMTGMTGMTGTQAARRNVSGLRRRRE